MGRLLWLVLAGIGLSACGARQEVWNPPAAVAANPALARMRVFVAVPSGQATDNECTSYGQSLTLDALRSAVQRELTNAGMVVVIDETTPHDLVANLGTVLNYCSQRYGAVAGSAQLTLVGGGRMLSQESYQYDRVPNGVGITPDGFAQRGAMTMVRNSLGSAALNDFAQNASAGPGPGAVPVPSPVPVPVPVPVPDAAGCSKDTDCKGDRVCEKGACTSPH